MPEYCIPPALASDIRELRAYETRPNARDSIDEWIVNQLFLSDVAAKTSTLTRERCHHPSAPATAALTCGCRLGQRASRLGRITTAWPAASTAARNSAAA